jgi:superfamily II DNA or RNA helicase
MTEITELRQWQVESMQLWKENGFRGCIEVATGGGKTTFALAAYLELLKVNSNLKILVIVPTTALADQWFVNFEEDLNIDESQIKMIKTSDLEPDLPVNIAVINSARAYEGFCAESENIFLVVDECHRAGSNENSKALFSGTFASLGLSATPFREFDDGFHAYIEPVLGPVIFSYSLDDAIRDGVLASMTVTNIRIPLLESEKQEYDALTAKIGRAFGQNADQSIIDSLLRARSRLYNNAFYRVPTVLSLLERYRGERCLIFLESISAAQEALELLDEHNHSVSIYHSKLSDSVRRLNLKLFRRGVFDILIACRALDEGFNVPEARIAIIGAGTSSKRQRIQRMGRVLRSMSGKTSAEVLTIYATDVEEARLSVEAERLAGIVKIEWKGVVHEQ